MTETATLTVIGMKCGGCESSVNEKVGALSGVISVKSMHKENRVDVEFDESVIGLDKISQQIIAAGFEVKS